MHKTSRSLMTLLALLALAAAGCQKKAGESSAVPAAPAGAASQTSEGAADGAARSSEQQLDDAEARRDALLARLDDIEAEAQDLRDELGGGEPADYDPPPLDRRAAKVLQEQVAVAQQELAASLDVFGSTPELRSFHGLLQQALSLSQIELGGKNQDCPKPEEIDRMVARARRQLEDTRSGLRAANNIPNRDELLVLLDTAEWKLDRIEAGECEDGSE